MDVQESKPSCSSSVSAGILDRVHNVQIDGCQFKNAAGNSESMVDSSLNVLIFIKQDSGTHFRSMLVLLIIAFLIFR